MITKEQAVSTIYSQKLYFWYRGRVQRAKVNGKCQTWVRTPERWRLPMKYGLRDCFDIDQYNCHQWYLTYEEVPRKLTTPVRIRIYDSQGSTLTVLDDLNDLGEYLKYWNYEFEPRQEGVIESPCAHYRNHGLGPNAGFIRVVLEGK